MPAPAKTQRRKPGRPRGRPSGKSKSELLKAARAIVGEQGFGKLSIKQVADKANVNSALAHYYFGNKDGLLDAVIDHMIGELTPAIENAVDPNDPPEEQIRNIVQAYVTKLLEDPTAARFALEHLMMSPNEKTKRFVDAYIKPVAEFVAGISDGPSKDGAPPNTSFMFTQITIAGAALFYSIFVPAAGRIFGVKKDTPDLQAAFAEYLSNLIAQQT